jgi:long-chain acyl-CoA synthetase
MSVATNARTIPDILLEARRHYADRPAVTLRDPERGLTWTYDQLVAAAAGVARHLHEQGVGRGDRVVLWGANEPAWAAAYFGALMVGAVIVPLDARCSADFAERVFARTEPRLQILGASQEDHPRVPLLRFANLPAGDGPGAVPAGVAAAEDLAEIVFTSGTTGNPKGVMLTHRNIVANVRAMFERLPILSTYRFLSLLPLSHMFEQAVGLGLVLSGGASIVYLGSLRPDAIFEALRAERITSLVAVPQVLQLYIGAIQREVQRAAGPSAWEALQQRAAALPFEARRAVFQDVHERLGNSLTFFVVGGTRLEPALGQLWENLGVKVLSGYGVTEASPTVSASSLEHRNLASMGRPLSCNEVRLAPDGEVQLRGENVSPGYWEDPAATEAAFEDGWYCTGDLARQDADGYLYFIGRKKNVIVLLSGENVYPEDVENLLVLAPAIRDAVVLGLERAGGEVEVHAVLLTDDASAATAAVREINRRLATHQRVRGSSIWPEDDFPRTLTLKARRLEILERVLALGHSDPASRA